MGICNLKSFFNLYMTVMLNQATKICLWCLTVINKKKTMLLIYIIFLLLQHIRAETVYPKHKLTTQKPSEITTALSNHMLQTNCF